MMTWIFGISAVLIAVVMICFRNHKNKLFQGMNLREHPLKWFYPASAKILDLFRYIVPEKREGRISHLLRSIYVKENIDREKYLYDVRKISAVAAAFFAVCIIGTVITARQEHDRGIYTLQRAEYGGGTIHYDLGMEYQNQEQTIGLDIDEVKYSDSEIYELFEWSYDDICRLMLGKNESADQVTEPLNLITEYRGINLFWEIEDLSVLDYNGELHFEGDNGETKILNLYVTFSMDDISQIFRIPIRLCGKDPDENEQLVKQIREKIRLNNSIYSRDVRLPDELNGYQIRFREKQENHLWIALLLGICAIALIPFLFDRSLEERDRKRRDQMLLDFTEIVSKLTLLYEAGQSIQGAFWRIAADYESRNLYEKKTRTNKNREPRYAYREIRLALEKISSGVSEGEAYAQFGKRCGLYPYIKLGNLLEQNLNKGTKGMKQLLKQEVSNSFEERKRIARKKGEEAGTKILIPMIMLLVIIIVIVAVPAMISIRV